MAKQKKQPIESRSIADTQTEFEEKSGYTIESLDQLLIKFETARAPRVRMWKFLDAYDAGKFWEVIKAKTPKHQVLPETNHLFHIKSSMINSLYASPYIADISPMFKDAKDTGRHVNQFIEYEYNKAGLGYKQLEISERTALLNIGFIQFGWDDAIDDRGFTNDGGTTYTKRDPLNVVLDPGFTDFQKGRALFIYTEDSIENILFNYPDVASILESLVSEDSSEKKLLADVNSVSLNTSQAQKYTTDNYGALTTGMAKVIVAYRRVNVKDGKSRVDQIIYLDSNKLILKYVKGIEPNVFPVVGLYSTPPEKDGYGIGVAERVIKNVMALNILSSISVTHVYASQRTPWIFDGQSGLTMRQVLKDMNKPDRAFEINNGDVSKVIQRLEYPDLPSGLDLIKKGLQEDIELVSGVDMKYIGRETNSISTTGGMERLQQRVSMTDNTRISMIEKYAKDMSKMMLAFYISKGKKQTFMIKEYDNNEKGDVIEVEKEMTLEFSILSPNKNNFLYTIDASPLLPKTRARLAESANLIMQIQMQYAQAGQQIELMTPEEWLSFQDFPQKNMILDRMKIQRLHDDQEEIAAELNSFSAMTQQGVSPEAAVKQLAQERKMRKNPTVQKQMLQQK